MERNSVYVLEDIRTPGGRLGLFKFDVMTRLRVRYSAGTIEFPQKASTPALGLTHIFIKWVTGEMLLGIKRPGLGANHSPSYIAEVKKERMCVFLSPMTAFCVGTTLDDISLLYPWQRSSRCNFLSES